MDKIKQVKKTKFINGQFDFILLMVVLLLLALGIIMVLSASAPSALSETGNSYTYFNKQCLFAIGGIILMIILSKVDYRIYKRFYKLSYIISVASLLLVVIPGLGISVNGATRWINLGFTQFQPSELTKIGLIVFYAGYLTDHKRELNTLKGGFIKPVLLLLPAIVILVLVQDHLSVCIVLVGIIATMMLMAGSRVRDFLSIGLSLGGLGVVGLIALAKVANIGKFRLARITTFLDPWSDPTGAGWQVIQSLYAIGSGGLFGVGLGESKQKYLYIPEPHNDFIFSILAEELGFIGCTVVVILFAIFIWRGVIAAMKAPDMFGSLIAMGIVSLVGVQVVINIAVVTSSMPATGMPLPFFSCGGTALTILLAAVGVLLNISRSNSKL
ncbi:MAG: putative lipid II flippase FtsW [Clostridia bacterium]|nr:putative lipid II flippase FtsW [Clostridia bacterium]